MPKLHVFDDDYGKLKIANYVLEELKQVDPNWEIGFCKELRSNWREATSVLGGAADCVCVIDVELLREERNPNAWEDSGFNEAISVFWEKGLLSDCDHTKKTLQIFRALFGQDDDYTWAIHAFTYVKQQRIPSLAISTKDHGETGDPFNSRVRDADFASLFQWKAELSGASEQIRRPRVKAMAARIHQEWEKWCGRLEGRIWGTLTAPQQNTRREWFRSDNTHSVMKHDHSSCISAEYKLKVREFLDSVINKGKQDPIDFSNYEITLNCHEAIKRLVGAVAKVDNGPGNERVPDLNTIVLLAAAWDPNAKSWFRDFQWTACHPLMREDASKAQLRAAIIDIGGEDAFFHGMLIDKRNAAPTNNKWASCQSFVKNVSATRDSVLIELGCDCSKLVNNFNLAKQGREYLGGSCTKLVAAWKSLATCQGRTVDIDMQLGKLSFVRSARP